jgi:hypothetical protein
MNTLTEERKLLLKDKFFEFTFDDKEPDKNFFETINDPLEYHYIASIYNWDDGVEVLSSIVNNPICDKGTAKMIFWRSQPSYYTRFLTEEEAGYDSDIFSLVKSIVDNFQNGFYSNQNIYYNPIEDSAAEETDYIDQKAKWQIPEFMREPSPGIKIDLED